MRAHLLFLVLAGWATASWADDAIPITSKEAYGGGDSVLLQEVRNRFGFATESGEATREIRELLDSQLPADPAEWPPVFRAYHAALDGLAGKHSAAPWTKYRRAKASLAGFSGLVEAHPGSIEIRMLRYSTCSQLPDFFHVGEQVEADLKVLAELLARNEDPMVPATLREGYIQWILDNGHPAPVIRKQLEAALAPAD